MSSEKLYSPRKPRYAVVLFGPEGQGSFNESGLRGAHKARDAGHEVDVLWVAGQSAQQRAAEMSALCGGRYALILAHGGQGDGPVQILAERWPEQAFAVTQGSWAAPNVARYEVLQEQSAFLAGVLASQWSKTGKVGHFSGEKVPPGLRGRAAYADGLRRAGFEGSSSPSSAVTSIARAGPAPVSRQWSSRRIWTLCLPCSMAAAPASRRPAGRMAWRRSAMC
jgi:basic membrane protein A